MLPVSPQKDSLIIRYRSAMINGFQACTRCPFRMMQRFPEHSQLFRWPCIPEKGGKKTGTG